MESIRLDQWIPLKQAIIAAIEQDICGYIENKNSGNWQRPRQDNIMMSVVQLNKIPEDINKIPVLFINTDDPKADPSDRDIDTILARTKHVIRRAIEDYIEPNEEVIEPELIKEPATEPTPTPMPKPKTKPPAKSPKKSSNVPAKVEKPQLPAKTEDWRKGRTDAEIAKEIEDEQTKKFLQERGKSYPVAGTDRPDAHAIQHAANTAGVNTEIIKTEQNENYCEVIVRAHLGNSYADGVVHHDFAVEKQLKTMEMINNNPQVLERWGENGPILKTGATIKQKTKDGYVQIDAQYSIVHSILQQKKFAIRDARTKAASIAQAMVLNRDDWRDPEELQSEYDERNMVQNSIEIETAMRKKQK